VLWDDTQSFHNMKIVADNAIPFLQHFFSPLGEITAVAGCDIGPAQVRDADVLLVRTLTRVNEELLAGSRVRFVGTPTSGTDHLDIAWLERAGIGWAAAPGCNARSVAEYVVSALLVLTESSGRGLDGMRAGIIGCGQVGSMVARMLRGVGVECVLHDPPLQAATGGAEYLPLPAALDTDIVTLHVPLTRSGRFATAGLVDAAFLDLLRTDAILVNTARGEAVDESALLSALRMRSGLRAIIDVWTNEPSVNTALLLEADIATPHIAGYSTDGRLGATATIADALRRIAGAQRHETTPPDLPDPGVPEVHIAPGMDRMTAVQLAVLSSYDVRSDAIVLRRLALGDAASLARGFSEARNTYPLRREFAAHRVVVPPDTTPVTRAALDALGFQVREAE
jgi:erythronate-4-phosphate dehydrogenase